MCLDPDAFENEMLSRSGCDDGDYPEDDLDIFEPDIFVTCKTCGGLALDGGDGLCCGCRMDLALKLGPRTKFPSQIKENGNDNERKCNAK